MTKAAPSRCSAPASTPPCSPTSHRQRSWRLLLETLLSSGDRVQAAGEARALERALQADGRETEFATLLRAWQAARGGAPRHVHVAGAVGLGKTRLLADAVARLRASGVRTISVRAHHTERQMEFAVASDLAASLAALPGSAATAAVRAALY
jgi:predicted ATPase